MDRTRRPRGPAQPRRAAPGNRLHELRKLRQMTQTELATAAVMSQEQISKLERDDRRMTFAYAQRLAAVLGAAPADLMPNGRLSIPVAVAIAMADFAERPQSFDLPEPKVHVQSPLRLAAPQDCFAAEVYDDSANLLYPAGSTLIVRRLDCEAQSPQLAIGDKIVVRSFAGSRREGHTHQVLAGLLDRSIAGDLLLLTRSSNRDVPSSVVIQRGAPRSGVSERVAVYRVNQDRQIIDYEATAFDPAEIIGKIEYAITPE